MIRKAFLSLLPGIKCLAAILYFLILPGKGQLNAQVLDDTSTLHLAKKTVDLIYNMQFSDAAETNERINKLYPDHPVVFLLRGMIIFWENYPLLAGSEKSRTFEEQMYNCIEKSEEYEPENEAEFLLANLCARGSLLAYYNGNDLQSKVISVGRTTYRQLRRSFKFAGIFPDFYFFTGLYNYYREAYPEAHPVYKPLVAVFPRGDKDRGMYELRLAFRESIFLKAEASTFLSSNYKYFENDFKNASYFSKLIYNEYPSNIVYKLNCIEDFLLTGKYNEAEKLIESIVPGKLNKYYQAQLMILEGILKEKKYKNTINAEKQYLAGVENISEYSNYGNQYAAYAYYGLSRISGRNNDGQNERIYRRKAVDLTISENVSLDD